MWYVLVDVKINPEWNHWVALGGFAITRNSSDTPEWAAKRARMIVDRKGEDTVRVQVLGDKTGLYDTSFTFHPIKF